MGSPKISSIFQPFSLSLSCEDSYQDGWVSDRRSSRRRRRHASSETHFHRSGLGAYFDFLDDDGSNTVSTDELKALTTTGDADGNGEVTALEFETAWGEIATTFGVPAEKHAKYFKLVDGVDG